MISEIIKENKDIVKNDKPNKIEKKLYELISDIKNIAINWYAMGSNFISWDITPMKKENFTQDFYLWCELLAQEIGKQMDFYCCPETIKMNGWMRITFMF